MARKGNGTRRKTPGESPEGQRLREFTREFFTRTGCQVVARQDELHVALSPEMEALFGSPVLKLAFRARDLLEPDVHLIQPGSVLLERMVTHLRERVGIATADLTASVAAEAVLPPEILFRCEARLGRVTVTPEEYLTFNFRVSYVCDTKNEEVRSITLDGDGGVVTDADLLARLASAPPGDAPIETSRRTLGALYAAAEAQVRADAEQRAKQIEQETLPRLYREITRLRAFYQNQMAELDPRIEQEAELRDHYERELRLRIDEEVHNHRLTLSLALLNYRIVRVPHARYSVRLQTPHAHRTVVLARDLSTGALLHPACEACGHRLESVELCAGGHLICPECARPCARCGRVECPTCGAQRCARCGEVVCGECRVTCAVCSNVVCRDHSGTCPLCGRQVCHACLRECAVCHTAQCLAHLLPCQACGEVACASCREGCATCGGTFCTNHTGSCARCGQVFCRDHLGACAVCGAECCHPHLEQCRTCGVPLCEAHVMACGGCGAPVCPAHAEGCAVCGTPVCAACGETCASTNRRLCHAHVVACAACGAALSREAAGRCATCDNFICDEHATECLSCGKVGCPQHMAECLVCGQPYCPACMPSGSACPICNHFEHGEPLEASAVWALEGLPRRWMTAARSASWWRVRRGERCLYYGVRPTHLLVAVADAAGRVVLAREFFMRPMPDGSLHLRREH